MNEKRSDCGSNSFTVGGWAPHLSSTLNSLSSLEDENFLSTNQRLSSWQQPHSTTMCMMIITLEDGEFGCHYLLSNLNHDTLISSSRSWDFESGLDIICMKSTASPSRVQKATSIDSLSIQPINFLLCIKTYIQAADTLASPSSSTWEGWSAVLHIDLVL